MSSGPETQDMTLEDAITQMIHLGENDPVTIARKVLDLRGGEWVARQLAANWEDILAEIARQRIGNERRAAIVSIGAFVRQSDGGKVAKRDAILTTLFVPKQGYIKLGDATPGDLREAAAYRRRLAAGLQRWADWLDVLAADVEKQRVGRVRDMRGALPPLPAAELEAAS